MFQDTGVKVKKKNDKVKKKEKIYKIICISLFNEKKDREQ
jgi:hypothetical protein